MDSARRQTYLREENEYLREELDYMRHRARNSMLATALMVFFLLASCFAIYFWKTPHVDDDYYAGIIAALQADILALKAKKTPSCKKRPRRKRRVITVPRGGCAAP